MEDKHIDLIGDMEFSWKDGAYEARLCTLNNTGSNDVKKNTSIELVKWTDNNENTPVAQVLARFERTDDGYDLRIIGPDLFENMDEDFILDVWNVFSIASTQLEQWFILTYNNDIR